MHIDELPANFSQRFLDAKYQEVSDHALNEHGVPFDDELHAVLCDIPKELKGVVLLKNALNREYVSALNCELLSQNKSEVSKRKNALEVVNRYVWNALAPSLQVSKTRNRRQFTLTQDWKAVVVFDELGIEHARQEAEIEEIELSITLPKGVAIA